MQGPSSSAVDVSSLIAPCGLDCRVCRAFMRPRNPCPGCRGDDARKAKTCVTCRIKNCAQMAARGSAFCAGCAEFPCARLAHLDKRYRARYGTSPIADLLTIQALGLAAHLQDEEARWACPGCGARLCMHEPTCPACGLPWR